MHLKTLNKTAFQPFNRKKRKCAVQLNWGIVSNVDVKMIKS